MANGVPLNPVAHCRLQDDPTLELQVPVYARSLNVGFLQRFSEWLNPIQFLSCQWNWRKQDSPEQPEMVNVECIWGQVAIIVPVKPEGQVDPHASSGNAYSPLVIVHAFEFGPVASLMHLLAEKWWNNNSGWLVGSGKWRSKQGKKRMDDGLTASAYGIEWAPAADWCGDVWVGAAAYSSSKDRAQSCLAKCGEWHECVGHLPVQSLMSQEGMAWLKRGER